ncbi:MAG: polysaccharide biosynthesis tyrosine autokinase [Friedmanniella sp.]|nr:polysaccharide biosynthesis tyrosine autokinase [Friedmanniella sp.]
MKGTAAVDLRDYLTALRRGWVIALAIMLATVAVAATVTFTITPRYTATTRLFFGVQGGDSGSDLANGSAFAEKQMSSYAEVATSPLVLNQVISRLGLTVSAADLAEHVVADNAANTVILDVSVSDTNRELAATIANSIGTNLAAVASELSPERPDGSQAVRATVLTPASVPLVPSSPHILRNLAAAAVLGLLLGAGFVLARRALDTKVRSEADVAAITDSSILGVVPFDAGAPTHPVIMRDDPHGTRAEAVRRLRTNLQFVDVAENAKSIVITSSVPNEGKSTTAINLAVSLADAGSKVILVDADLRRPSVANYLGLEGRVGLTTVLIGNAELDDVVQTWQDSSLDLLPAGQIPPNPSELLGSKAMASLMAELCYRYDIVLFDSPPLLPVTDSAILGRLAGGTLVVVGADRIHRPQLRESLDSLTTAGVNVLGMVLNKVTRRELGYYAYGYGYSSDSNADTEQAGTAPQQVDIAPAPDATRPGVLSGTAGR